MFEDGIQWSSYLKTKFYEISKFKKADLASQSLKM